MNKLLSFRAVYLMLALSTLTNISSCTTDKCSTVTCQNNGTCEDGNCKCASGYEGSECETKANAKFVGAYSGSDDCYEVAGVGIEALMAGAAGIRITYEFDNLDENSIEVEGKVDGNNITISSQSVTINGVDETYSATGTISGNTITLYSNITEDGISYSCTFTGNK